MPRPTWVDVYGVIDLDEPPPGIDPRTLKLAKAVWWKQAALGLLEPHPAMELLRWEWQWLYPRPIDLQSLYLSAPALYPAFFPRSETEATPRATERSEAPRSAEGPPSATELPRIRWEEPPQVIVKPQLLKPEEMWGPSPPEEIVIPLDRLEPRKAPPPPPPSSREQLELPDLWEETPPRAAPSVELPESPRLVEGPPRAATPPLVATAPPPRPGPRPPLVPGWTAELAWPVGLGASLGALLGLGMGNPALGAFVGSMAALSWLLGRSRAGTVPAGPRGAAFPRSFQEWTPSER